MGPKGKRRGGFQKKDVFRFKCAQYLNGFIPRKFVMEGDNYIFPATHKTIDIRATIMLY